MTKFLSKSPILLDVFVKPFEIMEEATIYVVIRWKVLSLSSVTFILLCCLTSQMTFCCKIKGFNYEVARVFAEGFDRRIATISDISFLITEETIVEETSLEIDR